ncbi:MAG: type II toxin-antitoxin system VapC family toxin [Candidatus Bathyarchaeota archaeon]|nr:type II toxin-antitoxin system VapC family toxin [Candidatus Bathyarchaeota archaeon]MDI9578125.1 type II toxin-antitoxin system VapC family toxin [Thermoproteota archaeon]NLD65175.1 type II toxin-antitoxin system VapC family toxin [Thermoproteota archaeon]
MARCREIVLDSSVVVKWFSAEIKSDEALKLLDSYTEGSNALTVSEILFCEVGNALRYKPDYDAQKWKTALAQLYNLHMNVTHLNQDIILRAGEIAYDGKITFYDALPVAIAEHKKTVCITADEETQYKKLQPKGYPIELL